MHYIVEADSVSTILSKQITVLCGELHTNQKVIKNIKFCLNIMAMMPGNWKTFKLKSLVWHVQIGVFVLIYIFNP